MHTQKKKDMEKEWGKIPTVARFADLSPRTIRNLIKSGQLRYSRLASGTVLIKLDWMNAYLEQREIKESQMDRIVESLLSDCKKTSK